MNEKTFNGFTFLFEEKVIEQITQFEIVEVYSKITIIKSTNPKFKDGDKIDQISIHSTIYFEHEDGTPY